MATKVSMATKSSNGNLVPMETQFQWKQKFQWQLSSDGNKSFNGNKKFQWKQKFQWQPTDPKDQKVQNVTLAVWLHMQYGLVFIRTWSKPNLIIENWFWVQWCAPAKIQIFLRFFLLIEFCQIKQKVENGSCSRHSCVNQDDFK